MWSEECETAFRHVKAVLCELPVLRAPDFAKPFALAVDASQVGVGAVLMQPDEENVNHPVCYFSKKFTPAQRNYSVVEQELLAIILALQHFEIYTPAVQWLACLATNPWARVRPQTKAVSADPTQVFILSFGLVNKWVPRAT